MKNEGNILRIIDANLNRAMEGVRVVEEIVRFVLEDKRLAFRLKEIRGRLSKVIRVSGDRVVGNQDIRRSGTLLRARRVSEDVGREHYSKTEKTRKNIIDVFHSNMKRAQEAVRCLEEFSKLISPKYGQRFKAVRFQLYDLESQLAPRIEKAAKLGFTLYIVTDPRLGHLKTVRRAVAGGVKIVQLRDKSISKAEYLKLAKQIAGICRQRRATFILNDYYDLVKTVGADGVHLGQEDLKGIKLTKVRQAIGEDKIIGVSTHSYIQAVRAEKLGADYISVGPIFTTPSKPGIKPVGLGLLRKVLRSVKIPVVAIGGINKANIDKVKQTGCQRLAVIRAAQELIGR